MNDEVQLEFDEKIDRKGSRVQEEALLLLFYLHASRRVIKYQDTLRSR